MGFMDKIKGLFKGRKQEVKSGIDTASDQVEKRVGPEHAAKVEDVAGKAKDAVDKIAVDEPSPAPAAPPAAPTAAPTPAPAEPAAPPAEPPAAPPS